MPSYAVTVTGLKDETVKERVARSIARISKNADFDRILKRLGALPWTVTRSASESMANRLVKLLEGAGASVEVDPPLVALTALDVPVASVESAAERQWGAPIAGDGDFTEAAGAPPPLSLPSSSLEIEPLTLGGILDRSFFICRRYFWKFIGILVIPWAATAAMTAAVVGVAGIYGLTRESLGEASTWGLIVIAAIGLPSVLVALVGLFYLSQGAVINAVASVYTGREVRIKEAYLFVFNRLGRYLLTSFLMALVVMLMIAVLPILGGALYYLFELLTPSGWLSAVTWPLLVIIPGYGIPKLLLFDKVVIIEDVAYTAALKRSWNLTSGKAEGPWPRGYFLRLVLLLNLFIFINFSISALFGLPASVIKYLLPEALKIVGTILGQMLSQTGSLIASLFGSVCMVVFYYDIRNRKEGFDLTMLAGMQDRRGQAGSASPGLT